MSGGKKKTNGGKKKTHRRHSELSFVGKSHWEPFTALLDVLRYHYIPLTPKDAYTGKYGGLEKRHTITIAFLDETRYHDYRQQNRAVSNGYWRTQWSHNNGYRTIH